MNPSNLLISSFVPSITIQLKTDMEHLRTIAIQMEPSGIRDLVPGLLSFTSVNSGNLLILGSLY